MKKLLMVLPFALLLAGVTYSSFSEPVAIGINPSEPNIVSTTDLEWNLYKVSEVGWPWSHIPDVGDARLDDPSWSVCMAGCLLTTDPTCYCEDPDLGNAAVSKLDSKTIHFEISNAYPAYAAVAHFVFVNEGGMPSKLREIKLDLDDPEGLDKDLRTVVLLVWDTDPDEIGIKGAYIIGYKISELPDIIESVLADEVFLPGGWVGFCKPEDADVQIVSTIVSDDSGLSEEQIDIMLNTDSFWIYVPQVFDPPQDATMDFNMTFVFGQFNE